MGRVDVTSGFLRDLWVPRERGLGGRSLSLDALTPTDPLPSKPDEHGAAARTRRACAAQLGGAGVCPHLGGISCLGLPV